MPSAPETLHQSEGLRIVRNPSNQFVVASLMFNADPRKRSPEWLREAQAGMEPAKFAREYLLDYRATQGAKVFPEIMQRRDSIVVPSFEVPEGPRMYGSFDYGTRNPSAFHVYVVIDDTIYVVWELYEPCQNIPDLVARMKACPYWKRLRYIAADPSLWTRNQQQQIGPPIGIQDQFYRQGVKNFVQGRNDAESEQAWIGLMKQAWSQEVPGIKIFSTCRSLIKEFELAIYVPQSERELLSSVYKELINDKDNHALDGMKYFMLSRPKDQVGSTWKDPLMVNRFAAQPTGPARSARSADANRPYR